MNNLFKRIHNSLLRNESPPLEEIMKMFNGKLRGLTNITCRIVDGELNLYVKFKDEHSFSWAIPLDMTDEEIIEELYCQMKTKIDTRYLLH